jgi:hypothetical protein
MTLIYPVGLARSLYHLFRDKVPPAYPTRFSVGYSGYFVSLILRHTILHTDNDFCISDFIKVVFNTSVH